jgi:hypothetical protein
MFRGQQQLAGLRVDRRHHALAEDPQFIFSQAEPIVLGEERDGLVMCRRTGHQVQRDRCAVPPRDRAEPFDQNLKQGPLRDRTERKHALGVLEPETRSLAAGNKNQSELPVAQSLLAASDRVCGRELVVRRIQSNRTGRLCLRRERRPIGRRVLAFDELLDQLEIDGLELCRETRLLLGVEFVPKGEQVLLTGFGETGYEFVVLHDSISRWASLAGKPSLHIAVSEHRQDRKEHENRSVSE